MNEQAKGVYAITNTENGHVYIGATTVSFAARWTQHRQALNRGVHVNPKLQADWTQHGADVFGFSVLEVIADDALILAAEQRHISAVATAAQLYNTAPAMYRAMELVDAGLWARYLEAEEVYEAVSRELASRGGGFVLSARRNLGMTQRAFAEALGVDFTYISKIERGHSAVSRALLGKIARLLAGEPVDDRRSHAPALP